MKFWLGGYAWLKVQLTRNKSENIINSNCISTFSPGSPSLLQRRESIIDSILQMGELRLRPNLPYRMSSAGVVTPTSLNDISYANRITILWHNYVYTEGFILSDFCFTLLAETAMPI